jgi:HK97 family phage portal protein
MVTDYISTIISQIPIKIQTKSGKESKNQELLKLISQPNYYQNWNELIKQFFAYYELLGNGYLYAIIPEGMKIVSQLYCLPSQVVGIVLMQDNNLPSWLNEVVGYKISMGGKEYNLNTESVLHKRYFNLQYQQGSYIYGMSKYVAGNKIANELKAIYEAKTSIISARGALGILSNESNIPDADQMKEIKKKLRESYGLGNDLDKVIVTTQKLTFQQMALGLQELQILENAKYSFEKICQLNGFDPVIFSTEGSTFANKAEARKNLIKNVIKSKVDDFYNDFNAWLSPYFGGDIVTPDWSQVDELQADQKLLTDIYVRQIEAGIITPFMAHELIFGEVDKTNPPPNEYFTRGLRKLNEPEEPKPDVNGMTQDELEEYLNTYLNGNGKTNGKAKNILI